MINDIDTPAIDAISADQKAVLDALVGVFVPLAQLCIAKGIRIPAVEERLRSAFVVAARDAHPNQLATRLTSRISATTGLTRREVARLEREPDAVRQPQHSPMTELFTRWMSDPEFEGADGKPQVLARQGKAPSFESLAQSITRDVHPRTLLNELCRLQIAAHDVQADTVQLIREAFVPRGDWARMLAFLRENVGDHFRAAVANVLQESTNVAKPQIEQAIFADELSAESLASAHELMGRQWRALLAQVVPELEKLIEADQHAGRAQDQSLRIGLYTWSEPMPKAVATPNLR
jgi:Family of unknown function (DUF6502)